jgi:hypothetical protein
MSTPLAALDDIEGVMGSFFTSHEGELLCRRMPSFVERAELERAGPRLLSIVETFGEARLAAPESFLLRFADHRLNVRRSKRGILCVLAEPGVNLPALRMASKLVCKRLDEEPPAQTELPLTPVEPQTQHEPIAEPKSEAAPPTRRSAGPPEAQHHAAPSSASRTLVYRGRKYDV